ncbi:MAG: hypothetical protein ACJ8GN_28925 [Longimicrobiaceae bacterium]
MRRTTVCLMALMVMGAVRAEAQECRRYVGGRVVVCDRDRDRDRDREHRYRRHGWDRGPVEFGIRGGYDFEDDQGSAGAQIRLPLVRQFAVAPSFDVFFGDDGNAEWQFNFDGLIRPRALGGVYLGGGAAVLRREFDVLDGEETKVGWNLLAGIEGGRVGGSVLRPFAEGRWTGVDDFTGFRLVAGFNVPISGFGR